MNLAKSRNQKNKNKAKLSSEEQKQKILNKFEQFLKRNYEPQDIKYSVMYGKMTKREYAHMYHPPSKVIIKPCVFVSG